jgi:hypothetical protein
VPGGFELLAYGAVVGHQGKRAGGEQESMKGGGRSARRLATSRNGIEESETVW